MENIIYLITYRGTQYFTLATSILEAEDKFIALIVDKESDDDFKITSVTEGEYDKNVGWKEKGKWF